MPTGLSAASVRAGADAVRALADERGYGSFISDELCREIAIRVLAASMLANKSSGVTRADLLLPADTADV